MPRRNWTRDELILAFALYCRIPFGKIHIRNPEVISLAQLLGRSPSAVSWKLANFARFDPYLKKRKIAGATHGSNTEQEIWEEFDGRWEELAGQGDALGRRICGEAETTFVPESFPEGLDRTDLVRLRVNQGFFRSAVLAAYDFRCCITGIDLPELLVASHIVPWVTDTSNRTNPRNGLCLNALHDRAFDCGLITVTPKLVVRVSPDAKKHPVTQSFLESFDGRRIRLPDRFVPDPELLQYHNEHIFRGEG